MCLRICPAASSRPLPTPSTPTLLLMVVRFFEPLRTSARMRFSGMPHSPNPPIIIVAPSNTSRMASSALATTLFIARRILNENGSSRHGKELLIFDWKPQSLIPGDFCLNHQKSTVFPAGPNPLQPVRPFKLIHQLPRSQILPDVCQPLLHFEQCFLKILAVGDGNVSPHRVRTR